MKKQWSISALLIRVFTLKKQYFEATEAITKKPANCFNNDIIAGLSGSH